MLYDESQQDALTAVRSIVDTWGKRCSQMIIFGDVPDIQVDSIPFLVIKNDNADSWKALASVLTRVIFLLTFVFICCSISFYVYLLLVFVSLSTGAC